MKSDLTATKAYGAFLREIKAQIRQRQLQALRAVNSELLALYWWLGENISRRQQELGWGKAVVETLAHDLQAEYPGRNGFSARNLSNMLDLYRAYADKEKLQPLVAEISWSKNLLIMARCKDDLEREFYLRATARFGWTKNVLQHQLDNQSYRQYLAGQTNFDTTLPDSIKAQAQLAVKDHYTFDFLGLADEHSERELEQALLRNLRTFLTELGGMIQSRLNKALLGIGWERMVNREKVTKRLKTGFMCFSAEICRLVSFRRFWRYVSFMPPVTQCVTFCFPCVIRSFIICNNTPAMPLNDAQIGGFFYARSSRA